MNTTEKKLWIKILNFEIDDPASSFSFSDRLSRENDWNMEYTLRTVLEYKKFIFLIFISKTPLTPSDQIDQVWHLHLLYTHSYWIDLCKNTINKDIHHGPTKGIEQRETFTNLYENTLNLYKSSFNQTAPEDIWPNSKKRFSTVNFSRVNRDRYWIIPKIKRN